MTQRQDYNIMIKKDGKFYVGYCLEIPQARGQGITKTEAVHDTKQAIKLCKSYLENKKKSSVLTLVNNTKLTIDFNHSHLLINSGSGVFITSGSKMGN